MTAATPAPEWLATTTLASDATDGEGVLPAFIRPLSPDMRVVARATTATVARDDALSFREATDRGPRPGTVLVVGGASGSRRACMGGLVAREVLLKGFEAVVTDGLVRDAADIRGTGLGVWCRGVCPIASQKRGGGQTGGAVLIGDVVAARAVRGAAGPGRDEARLGPGAGASARRRARAPVGLGGRAAAAPSPDLA